MDLYRDEILDHYKNPHNFGELTDPKISFEEYNPLCGDRLVLQLRLFQPDGLPAGQAGLTPLTRRVEAAMFKGEGCAISMAASSMLTDYIKGKSTEELGKLDGTKVLEILNLSDISPARIKCALLSFEALKKLLMEVI